MKILEEVTRRSGGVKLREDNILFLLSVKLKDLCNAFNVFIMSGTQLSGDYKTEKIPDQTLLRGAKSLADKIDVGVIMLRTDTEDKEALAELVREHGCAMPNMKMSIYKNRRGSHNRCYVWLHADHSICRFTPLFVTEYDYTLMPVKQRLNITKGKK